MWNTNFSKVKVYANRRTVERRRISLKIRRLPVLLSMSKGGETIGTAHALVNDLSLEGMGFYANQKLTEGQQIWIRFSEPCIFDVKTKVLWHMENLQETHIVSSTHYKYRFGVQFIFETEDEKKLILEKCNELLSSFNVSPAPSIIGPDAANNGVPALTAVASVVAVTAEPEASSAPVEELAASPVEETPPSTESAEGAPPPGDPMSSF